MGATGNAMGALYFTIVVVLEKKIYSSASPDTRPLSLTNYFAVVPLG